MTLPSSHRGLQKVAAGWSELATDQGSAMVETSRVGLRGPQDQVRCLVTRAMGSSSVRINGFGAAKMNRGAPEGKGHGLADPKRASTRSLRVTHYAPSQLFHRNL